MTGPGALGDDGTTDAGRVKGAGAGSGSFPAFTWCRKNPAEEVACGTTSTGTKSAEEVCGFADRITESDAGAAGSSPGAATLEISREGNATSATTGETSGTGTGTGTGAGASARSPADAGAKATSPTTLWGKRFPESPKPARGLQGIGKVGLDDPGLATAKSAAEWAVTAGNFGGSSIPGPGAWLPGPGGTTPRGNGSEPATWATNPSGFPDSDDCSFRDTAPGIDQGAAVGSPEFHPETPGSEGSTTGVPNHGGGVIDGRFARSSGSTGSTGSSTERFGRLGIPDWARSGPGSPGEASPEAVGSAVPGGMTEGSAADTWARSVALGQEISGESGGTPTPVVEASAFPPRGPGCSEIVGSPGGTKGSPAPGSGIIGAARIPPSGLELAVGTGSAGVRNPNNSCLSEANQEGATVLGAARFTDSGNVWGMLGSGNPRSAEAGGKTLGAGSFMSAGKALGGDV